MKFEQVLKLVDAVSNSSLTELNLEEEEVKLCLKKSSDGQIVVQSSDLQFSAQPKQSETKDPQSDESVSISGNFAKSPLVGTFYSAPSEDAQPYVKVGDHVKKGQTLAIVEAMKLMNEIESEFDGEIAEILVENASPVEYGQPLFVIR